jgi:hypothetical protein
MVIMGGGGLGQGRRGEIGKKLTGVAGKTEEVEHNA